MRPTSQLIVGSLIVAAAIIAAGAAISRRYACVQIPVQRVLSRDGRHGARLLRTNCPDRGAMETRLEVWDGATADSVATVLRAPAAARGLAVAFRDDGTLDVVVPSSIDPATVSGTFHGVTVTARVR